MAEQAVLRAEQAVLRAEQSALRAEQSALRAEQAVLRVGGAMFHFEVDERGDFYITLTEEGHFWSDSVSARLDATALTRLTDMLVKLRSSVWGDNATTKAGGE